MRVCVLLLCVVVILAVLTLSEAKKKKKEAGPCKVKDCKKCNLTGKKCKVCITGYKPKQRGKKCKPKPCFVNPCQNGGTCSYNKKKKQEKCVCPDGFSGDRCQDEGGESAPPPVQPPAPSATAGIFELENGPGCGESSIENAEECTKAAAELGYTAAARAGSWSHAPLGCFVGHPTDSWRNTYFNTQAGQTGRDIYRSICKGAQPQVLPPVLPPVQPADPCSPNPCKNGGSCQTDGSCQCSKGFIGDTCETEGSHFIYDGACPINKDSHLGRMSVGKTWRVTLEVKINTQDGEGRNLFQMTRGDDVPVSQGSGQGDKFPAAIWTWKNQFTQYCFPFDNWKQNCVNKAVLPNGEWITIIFETVKEGDNYFSRVTVNGDKLQEYTNPNPLEDAEFDIWLSNPWDRVTDACVRKLEIISPA